MLRDYLIVKQDILRETWSHVTPSLVTARAQWKISKDYFVLLIYRGSKRCSIPAACLVRFSLCRVKIVLTIEYSSSRPQVSMVYRLKAHDLRIFRVHSVCYMNLLINIIAWYTKTGTKTPYRQARIQGR